MSDLVKWLRYEGRQREDACIQEQEYCAKMRLAADEIERLAAVVDRARHAGIASDGSASH